MRALDRQLSQSWEQIKLLYFQVFCNTLLKCIVYLDCTKKTLVLLIMQPTNCLGVIQQQIKYNYLFKKKEI